ncbi:MAG TPA: pseudouridine synthase [bacterium]|nr:pseudouridine synthase [bacterium]
MRISRALAMASIDSRRKCEEHVRNGAVTVNGEVVRDLGRQVDPEADLICFRGRPVHYGKLIYYILNKPEGYTTTASDPYAKKTVYDLLPRALVAGSRQPKAGRTRVFPVGRLDRNSTGLLLFTNDGDLANRLMHPRYQIGKWYQVRLERAFDLRDGKKLMQGIRLEEGIAKVQKFRPLTRRILQVLIAEGKKREVRRIFEKLGYEVRDLMRIAFGPVLLGSLALGMGRYLSAKEIVALKKAVCV